jgi:hypothetical protein
LVHCPSGDYAANQSGHESSAEVPPLAHFLSDSNVFPYEYEVKELRGVASGGALQAPATLDAGCLRTWFDVENMHTSGVNESSFFTIVAALANPPGGTLVPSIMEL